MFEFFEQFLYKNIEIKNEGDFLEIFVEDGKYIVLYKEVKFSISEENFNELLKNTSFHKGVSAGYYIALHNFDMSIYFVSVKDKRYLDTLKKSLIPKKEIKIGDLVECYDYCRTKFIYLGDIFVIEKHASSFYYKKGFFIGQIEKKENDIEEIVINLSFLNFPKIKRVIEHINEFSSLKNNFEKYKLSLKPFESVNNEYYFYLIETVGKYVSDIYHRNKTEQKELTEEFNNLLKDSLCEELKKEDITLNNYKKCIAVTALNQKDVLPYVSIHNEIKVINYKYKKEIFKIYFYS